MKRAVLTEELYQLTGDDLAAIILRQFLYWAVRQRHVDEYLKEEKARLDSSGTLPEPTDGWIYKSARELSDEIMCSASGNTVRARIKFLVDKGWLGERRNPVHRWDQTLQYRASLGQIEHDLRGIGYSLATVMGKDYSLVRDVCEMNHNHCECIRNGCESILNHCESILNGCDAIPENTTETTTQNKDIGTPDAFASGGEAPPKKKRQSSASDPRSKSPAITCVRSVIGGKYPPKELYDAIINVLGENPDEAKLAGCRQAWLARGYNPNSWQWLLEWYSGGIPETANRSRASPGQIPKGFSSIQAWLQRKEADGET